MPITILLGWDLEDGGNPSDVLPSNLRRLRLSDDILCHAEYINWGYEDFYRSVRHYVGGRTCTVPELEVLSFRLVNFSKTLWMGEQQNLRELSKKFGIILECFDPDDIESEDPIPYSDNDDTDEGRWRSRRWNIFPRHSWDDDAE